MAEPADLALAPDGPPPPPMCDAWLDETQLNDLFNDLESCAEIVSVQVKAHPQAQVGDAVVSLELARQLFADGQIRGVQIRYRFQNHEWCDTLLRAENRCRLIRCQYA